MACPPTVSARSVFMHWLALIGLCALIFVQSHGLVLTHIPLPMHLDKLLHFVCFAVLAVLFYRAYHTLPFRKSVRRLMLLSLVSTVCYAIGDELHQSFVPLRVADRLDILADVAGALFGLGLYRFRRYRADRRNPLQRLDRCLS